MGDSISAVINGRLKKLRIVGIVLSPEYIYEIKPGDILPDNKHFGVLWMNHEAISTAYNLEGAFNDVTLSLMRGASLAEVLFRLDELIKPYGGLGAYGRKDQPSHMFLDNEIKQNRQLGLIMPTVFLGVASFLLNVVLTRTINLQREQIAALKAFGYNNLEVGWHYMKLVLLIVGVGLLFGIPCGAWFGQVVTGMYAKLFHFPAFTYHLTYDVVLTASLVSVIASILGAWSRHSEGRIAPSRRGNASGASHQFRPNDSRTFESGASASAGGADDTSAIRTPPGENRTLRVCDFLGGGDYRLGELHGGLGRLRDGCSVQSSATL